MRKFEIVKASAICYKNSDITLPVRATQNSCGYDFFSPIKTCIEPGKSELIFTNIKAYFNTNEMLMLFVTSKMGSNHICLANGTGIIDADYYENPTNDGNIGFRLLNLGEKPYNIEIGQKIGQGVFVNFLKVDNENSVTAVRQGGFGSTGKN